MNLWVLRKRSQWRDTMNIVDKVLSLDVSPEVIFDTVMPICPHLTFQGDLSYYTQIAKYIETHRKPNQRIIFPTRATNKVINSTNTYRIYSALKRTTIPDDMIIIMPISYSDDGCCMEPISSTDIVIWKNRLNLKASLAGEAKSVLGKLMDTTGDIPFTNKLADIFYEIYAELSGCYRNSIMEKKECEELFVKAYKVLLLEYVRWCSILFITHDFIQYGENMEQEIIGKLIDNFLRKLLKVSDLKTLTHAMIAELRLIEACTGSVLREGNMPISYRRYLTKTKTALTLDEYHGLLLKVSEKAKKPTTAIDFNSIAFPESSENSTSEAKICMINQEYISSHLNEYLPEPIASGNIVLELPQEKVAMLRDEYGNKQCSNIIAVPLITTKDFRVRYVYIDNDDQFLLFMIRGQDDVYGVGLNENTFELIQLKGDPRYKYEYSY